MDEEKKRKTTSNGVAVYDPLFENSNRRNIAMAEQQSIYFDSTYTLRVVEEDKFKDTERLKEECDEFTKSEWASCLCARPLAAQVLRPAACWCSFKGLSRPQTLVAGCLLSTP